VNALLYMMRTGCQWRMLPREFPPRSTVQRYFYAWREDGTWQRINHELLMGFPSVSSIGVIEPRQGPVVAG